MSDPATFWARLLLCGFGLHGWGMWSKPFKLGNRKWQSRTCERCGKHAEAEV